MTSGSVSIKNFSWALKTKKRHRSGSGGSKDHEAKKKSFLQRRQNAFRRLSNSSTTSSSSSSSVSTSNLEVLSPSTADIEFKYTWPIDGFLKRVKNGGPPTRSSSTKSCDSGAVLIVGGEDNNNNNSSSSNNGMDSKPFDININGVQTTWNLSIRFWIGEDGERLANPFVLCLNMTSCKVDEPIEAVGIKYKFGVLNRCNSEYEMGPPDTVEIKLETTDELKSIGYKNIAISEKHMNDKGDIQLVCKMNILKEDPSSHSLSSDLRNLINDEKSSDLVIEGAEGKTFKVHRNILCARSPVFADLLKESSSNNTENSSSSGSVDRLEIKDLEPETLEELLKYIYTDSSVNVDLFAQTLLAASDRFQLPGLKSHCEKHLGENITPSNVATILLLAHKYKCSALKKSALSYCKDNDRYIMKDEQWKTIEEEKPDLFEEAVAEVANDSCCTHTECLKKKGKRFEMEKNTSNFHIKEEEA